MARAEVSDLGDPQDVLQLDESTLDPEMHYRFCHPRNLARRRSQGYEIVSREESGIKLLNEDERLVTADDQIRVGNLILMACSKERFKKRRAQTEQLTKARLSSSEQAFEARAKKRGVRPLNG